MHTPPRLGRYVLQRRLATGGMGEVFLAQVQGAANFSRQVAIKRILPHLAQDRSFVNKFVDEANLLTRLHHGNIVSVVELADTDGELYLVMDYLPGRDLRALLRQVRAQGERLPVDLAVWLATEILAGLDYAHRLLDEAGQPLQIVHRDVSPSNVCLGAGGEVKLIDFGIARARGGAHQSTAGALQGKFAYMSPEQAEGQSLDARADVFSLGLLLYEMLTGRRPYEAASETETLKNAQAARVPSPSEIGCALDRPLEEILMRALQADRQARFQSANEMRRALQHYLADRRSEADAPSFAAYLAQLFPEGFVPTAAPAPAMSFDEALLAQLLPAAATPSATPAGPLGYGATRTVGHTPSGPHGISNGAGHTPSGPHGISHGAGYTPSGPHGISHGGGYTPSGPHGISNGAGYTPSGPHTGPATHLGATSASPAGLRALRLGLLLALVAAAAWWFGRDVDAARAILEVQTQPAEIEGVRVLVGEQLSLLSTGAQLPVGSTQLCVEAPGYARSCQYVQLKSGANRPIFALSERPEIAVQIEPAHAQASVYINDLLIEDWPYRDLPVGRVARVELRPGEGWEVDGESRYTLRIVPGLNRLRFQLLARPDMRSGWGAAAQDAAVAPEEGGQSAEEAPRTAEVGRAQPVHTARSATLALAVEPVAGRIECEDGQRGQGQLSLQARPKAVRCTFSAEDHASQSYEFSTRTGPRTVRLVRYARLTARAEPGAAQLLLNGQPLPTNPVRDYPVQPGTHRLRARLHLKGVEQLGPEQRVTLAPGERLDEAVLVRVEPPKD